MRAQDIARYEIEEVDSTNLWACREAQKGARAPALFVALRQSGGLGRMGRAWQSEGMGLYMSLLLRPDAQAQDMARMPLLAALAVCEALAEFGVAAQIKWPNDVVAQGRKICGILCESRLAGQKAEFCVMGAGINLSQRETDFPPEIRDAATSVKMLTGETPERDAVIGAFLRGIQRWYGPALGRGEDFWRAYREQSATLGQGVRVLQGREEWAGVAREIAGDGALLVETPQGMRAVYAGDVSVRGIMGYV